jgi:hypothetical protein
VPYFTACDSNRNTVGTTRTVGAWQILEIATPGDFAIRPIGS